MGNKLLDEFLTAENPELVYLRRMESQIARRKRIFQATKLTTQPPRPLRLLLVGYAGAGNTGSDIRTLETIRQIKLGLGNENVKLTVAISDKKLAQNIFNHVDVVCPDFPPTYFFSKIREMDGVIACEGSLFKTNFSALLSINMMAAMGLALSENKLAVAYGAEAGQMNEEVASFAIKYCKDALIISRSLVTKRKLNTMGMRTTLGTDPAWAYLPTQLSEAHQLLRNSGWDGQQKILAVCPVNPFWWPVRFDFKRSQDLKGKTDPDQVRNTAFFHTNSQERNHKYKLYLQQLAQSIKHMQHNKNLFPIIIGMEHIDKEACRALENIVQVNIPTYVNGAYNSPTLAALLHHASYVLSSRFHALVIGMTGGAIPLGISFDERIDNLLTEMGHPELVIKANDARLANTLLHQFELLQLAQIKKSIQDLVSQNKTLLTHMQAMLSDEILRVFKDRIQCPVDSLY